MMRVFLMLMFAMLVCGSSYAARRVYSLPSQCSVRYDDKIEQYDRVEISATIDQDGRDSSPFEIDGYWGACKMPWGRVFGGSFALSNTLAKSEGVVSGGEVRDGFDIGDGHYNISATMIDGHYEVIVDNINLLRNDMKMISEARRRYTESIAKFTSESSAHEVCLSQAASISSHLYRFDKNGFPSPNGVLRLKGNLSQKGGGYAIRFSLDHERDTRNSDNLAKGCVTGEILRDGSAGEYTTKFDCGKELVSIKIRSPKQIPQLADAFERMTKAGANRRVVRMSVIYGDRVLSLDFLLALPRE